MMSTSTFSFFELDDLQKQNVQATALSNIGANFQGVNKITFIFY